MDEIGIDISHHYSKSITEFYGIKLDLVVTVCNNTQKFCPTFPGAKSIIHYPFNNPAAAKGSNEVVLNVFRIIRDQIKEWLNKYFK